MSALWQCSSEPVVNVHEQHVLRTTGTGRSCRNKSQLAGRWRDGGWGAGRAQEQRSASPPGGEGQQHGSAAAPLPGQFGSGAGGAQDDDMAGVDIGMDDVGLIDADTLEMLLSGSD